MTGQLRLDAVSRNELSADSEAVKGLVALFNAFYISGLLLHLLVLLTAFLSSNVRRAPLWYTFIICWMMYCIAFLLLIGHQSGPDPPHALCLTQASLVYASTPMTAFACLGLVSQLYGSIYALVTTKTGDCSEILDMLRVAPFIAYVLLICECAYLGISNPEIVVRDMSGMYCNFSDKTALNSAATLLTLCSLCVLYLDVVIFRIVFKNWNDIRRLTGTKTSNYVSIPMILRGCLFCLLPMIAVTLGLFLTMRAADWTPSSSAQINILTASVTPAGALIFGSQMDILRAWKFWKPTDTAAGFHAALPSTLIYAERSPAAGAGRVQRAKRETIDSSLRLSQRDLAGDVDVKV
ncbi:hypothetical protein BDZ89DRAFT_1074679 [Hymenopellis radicata]|nr:hypothetical protein BDZ89DRAFT_1074679 [Hymenopellis radicata]